MKQHFNEAKHILVWHWYTNRIPLVIASVIVIFILTGFSMLVFSSFKIQYSSYEREITKQKQKEEDQKAYQALLDKQKKANAQKTFKSDESSTPQAHGSHTIHIVLVKPPTVDTASIQPLIDTFSKTTSTIYEDCNVGAACPKNISLHYVPTYYKNEAKKYNVSDFSVHITISPVYTVTSLAHVGDMAQVWQKDPFAVANLQDDFEDILKDNNISYDANDFVEFFYFDNSTTNATKSESFYDSKEFRSFADPEKKRAYINIFNFSPLFSKFVTKVVAHETLHLFGASDKYIEYSEDKVCGKIGYGDPDKTPPLPQTTADIMCLYIELSDTDYKAGDLTQDTLVINKYTAKEIGWIKD